MIKHRTRLILSETSSREQSPATRLFYLKCGYNKEPVINDFDFPGDDKCISAKRLPHNIPEISSLSIAVYKRSKQSIVLGTCFSFPKNAVNKAPGRPQSLLASPLQG
jgi:hypothetical protein